MREVTRSARRETSALRCCTSANGSETSATVGVATSTILSAMSASLDRSVVSSAEASTMRTLAGSRWRKSSFRKALFSGVVPRWSPSSCWMRRRSWVGLRSPSSSPLISCWSFLCSDAAVRLINSALRVSYGVSVGGRMSKSRISNTISGGSEATT